MQHRTALFALHLGALFFGLSGIFGKLALAAPLVIVFGRALFAVGALAVFARIGEPRAQLSWRRRLALAGAGLLLGGHWWAFFIAVKVSGVAVATLGFASFPAFTVLLEGLLFREKVRRAEWGVVALVSLGLVLVTPNFDLGSDATLGLAWAVFSGLLFAMVSVTNRATTAGVKPAQAALWQNLAILLACLPLFSNYLYFGHDLEFHMQRIAAMAAELSYGQFPVRLTTTTLNGYGYASPLCYCELFLLLPALLYNLWLPLRTCYQVYLFAVTLATCLIAYFSFAKITASRRLGLLGALLYTLSAHRLTCVYTRAAVGEFTAMAFFPLVLLGLYGIYTSDRPRFGDWLPMALGMAAMVQSHLLSCELTALLLILWLRLLMSM